MYLEAEPRNRPTYAEIFALSGPCIPLHLRACADRRICNPCTQERPYYFPNLRVRLRIARSSFDTPPNAPLVFPVPRRAPCFEDMPCRTRWNVVRSSLAGIGGGPMAEYETPSARIATLFVYIP